MSMIQNKTYAPNRAAASHGTPMSIKELPPPDTKRWVIRRKLEVVSGIRAGLITIEEACARYTLSMEELLSWQHFIDKYGVRGLRVTKIQDYRLTSRAKDSS